MDTNVLSVAILLPRRSPYCSRIRALLMESEGPDSGYFAFAIVFRRMNAVRRQATCYSVISSIHIDGSGWVPVHVIRRGRTKLLSGSPAPTRGGQSRPHRCRSIRSRFGVHPSSTISDYARPISNSILRMRCHNRTAKRRITATMAIFFFLGLRATSC
jgi:hypothetical protein